MNTQTSIKSEPLPVQETQFITQRIQKTLETLDEVNRRLLDIEVNMFGRRPEKESKGEDQKSGNGFLEIAGHQLTHLENITSDILSHVSKLETL